MELTSCAPISVWTNSAGEDMLRLIGVRTNALFFAGLNADATARDATQIDATEIFILIVLVDFIINEDVVLRKSVAATLFGQRAASRKREEKRNQKRGCCCSSVVLYSNKTHLLAFLVVMI